MDPQKLQRFAVGCLGASAAVYLLRRRGQAYLGQSRATLPPFLVISNGDLVSVQHTYSNPAGVRVLLIPMLPVAQQTFYDDVVADLAAENALVLREGVQPAGKVPGAIDGGAADPPTDEASEFDKEFAGAAGPSVEWRDYGDTSSSSTAKSIDGRPIPTISHQRYFDTAVAARCSTTLADLSDAEHQWRLSRVFAFPPLAPERRDRLLRVLVQHAELMQFGEWGAVAGRGGGPTTIPDAIAIPWNVGACPAIAEALQEREYTLISKTSRVLLERAAFRQVFRLRVVDDSSSATVVANKALRL